MLKRTFMRETFQVAALSILLTACAAGPAPDGKQSDASVVCEREYPIGSNLPVTKCRTAAEREQLRRDAQKELDRVPATAPPSGGRSGV
jgi:hypothetical protein